MMRRLLIFGAAMLVALAPIDAVAKEKAKPAKGGLTMTDVNTCMGTNGSTPDQQIVACTKIIASGKVKPPHHGDYYATRAAAYFAKGELDKALADLNTAIGVRQAPEFYFQRALIYLTKRETELGKKDLAQVMKLKPEFTTAYLLRGIVAFKEGEYKEALKYFDDAVNRAPTYYQAIFARGVTKKKLGDESGGDKDIADARGMSAKVDNDMEKLGFKL